MGKLITWHNERNWVAKENFNYCPECGNMMDIYNGKFGMFKKCNKCNIKINIYQEGNLKTKEVILLKETCIEDVRQEALEDLEPFLQKPLIKNF